jgi:hypothetical protein
MPITTIRRRIGALETIFIEQPVFEYAPLTAPEISDLERRVRAGEKITNFELLRIEKQSPIIEGSMIMSCHKGNLYVKRSWMLICPCADDRLRD